MRYLHAYGESAIKTVAVDRRDVMRLYSELTTLRRTIMEAQTSYNILVDDLEALLPHDFIPDGFKEAAAALRQAGR